MVVDEGCGEVLGEGDGVAVAGEAEVHGFQRQDLAAAAAGGSARAVQRHRRRQRHDPMGDTDVCAERTAKLSRAEGENPDDPPR